MENFISIDEKGIKVDESNKAEIADYLKIFGRTKKLQNEIFKLESEIRFMKNIIIILLLFFAATLAFFEITL